MHGELIGDRVVLGEDAITKLYSTSYYGRPKEGKLELSLVEAAYLLKEGKISIVHDEEPLDFKEFFVIASTLMKNFELKYIVYKDMRGRGYYVQPSVTDFRLYPRGGKPGKTRAMYFVRAISEREPLPLANILHYLEIAENMRKHIILAVVDEESDITFYDVKKTSMKGETKFTGGKGDGTLLEDRVIVWDSALVKVLHQKGFFGKPLDEERLQLSLVESAYLMKKKVLKVTDATSKVIDLKTFTKRASKIEADFGHKLRVYENLRENGMVAKTGFKFGSHFRAYEKVESLDRLIHSKYLVHAISKDHVFLLPELSRAIRLAQSVRKRMIFGYVTGKNVGYIDIGRTKL
ncbi:MAG: tRNA-intron lyase [Methanosarcinales archaeon]|nr:MAG: tRNA-intron lyase [Methanosarcinales archaeon]